IPYRSDTNKILSLDSVAMSHQSSLVKLSEIFAPAIGTEGLIMIE
ncbi:2888_t:CDS:1, partial [Racocetra persica]